MNKEIVIPPPEERLCKIHGKPICPSNWKRGSRTTKCYLCHREYTSSPEAKQRRIKKWESEFISCSKHLDRRCNKSGYVRWSQRLCGSCKNRPSPKRKKSRSQKWEDSFISCIRHPNKRCKKSVFVHNGNRRCSSCTHKLISGEYRQSVKRHAKILLQSGYFQERGKKKLFQQNPRGWIYKMLGA